MLEHAHTVATVQEALRRHGGPLAPPYTTAVFLGDEVRPRITVDLLIFVPVEGFFCRIGGV